MNSVPWDVVRVGLAVPVEALVAVQVVRVVRVVRVADLVPGRVVMGQQVGVETKGMVPARAVLPVVVVLKGRGLDEVARMFVDKVVRGWVGLEVQDREGRRSPILIGCCRTPWNLMRTKTASSVRMNCRNSSTISSSSIPEVRVDLAAGADPTVQVRGRVHETRCPMGQGVANDPNGHVDRTERLMMRSRPLCSAGPGVLSMPD